MSNENENGADIERDKPSRDRFSVYADKAVFDRVKTWSTFLGVPQADIIERALSLYCDRLANEYNDGQDPVIPQGNKPNELP